jgi:hypothetical protein
MLRLWPPVIVLRRRKSRSDQIATDLSAVAVARREVCGCGEDCQARVMVGEERVARWVSVGGGGLDVIVGLDGGVGCCVK